MPVALSRFGGTFLAGDTGYSDNTVEIAGGQEPGPFGTFYNGLLSSSNGMAWTPLARSWPAPRVGAAVATSGYLVFVAGGVLADGGTSNELDIVNLVSSTWYVGPGIPLAALGGGSGVAYAAGIFDAQTNRFYVAGGYNGTSYLATTEAFLLNTGEWAY